MDYVKSLLIELLTNIDKYFDKRLVLNSDGRRLLNKIIFALLSNSFNDKKFIRNVRKEPTLENIIKLTTEILGFDARRMVIYKDLEL
ncbi:MAG: hypothetical protein QXT53_06730 [Ignisphaera sp.]